MKHYKKVLIVGTGLASYGACLALINRKNIEIDVCDIGLKRSYKRQPNYKIPNAKDINSSFYTYGINDNILEDEKFIYLINTLEELLND